MLGGHVHAVFTLVTIIFVICVSVTLNSFREIPLWKLESQTQNARDMVGAEQGAAAPPPPSTENDKLQPPSKKGAPQNVPAYGTVSNDVSTSSYTHFTQQRTGRATRNGFAFCRCRRTSKPRPKHHSSTATTRRYRRTWTTTTAPPRLCST